jgi:hypothetical protein
MVGFKELEGVVGKRISAWNRSIAAETIPRHAVVADAISLFRDYSLAGRMSYLVSMTASANSFLNSFSGPFFLWSVSIF